VQGGLRALVALAGAVLLLLAPAALGTASKPRGLASADALAARVLRGLNDLRGEHGLGPLRANPALAEAAQWHAVEMLEAGYFAHESADGTSYRVRLARFYRPGSSARRWSVGENLYWATPHVSAAQAIRKWMESPRHRINLLRGGWHDVGIAAVRASAAPGTFMGLSVTVLTVDFGAR
jgi:uncharacterized protein YkwD